MYNKNKKSDLYITTIRIVGFVLMVFLLYRYFYADFRPKELAIQIQHLSSPVSIFLLLISVVLMPINWVFESFKWKRIISEEFALTHWQAFKSIFRGVSLGIITPGRIGEYGGRILDLPSQVRKYGVLSTFVCSLSQNFINISVGIFAMLYVLNGSYFNKTYSLKIFLLALCVFALITFMYFKLNTILKYIIKLAFVRRRVGSVIIDFTKMDHPILQWELLYLSFFRYITYVVQYMCILYAFNIELSFGLVLCGIAIIFITQTLIPLSPLLQFTVRGSLASYVLAISLGGDEEAAVLSSYTMWFVNLLVPAIIGALWLLMTKLKSSQK